MKETVVQFKYVCREYLSKLSIHELRVVGRKIGVANSTEKKKDVLIEEIVAVLSGEQDPAEQSGRGAPLKNDHVNPQILERLESLQRKYLTNPEMPQKPATDVQKELREMQGKGKDRLEFNDPQAEQNEAFPCCGQVVFYGDNALLLSADSDDLEDAIFIPRERIEEYDIREGDLLTGTAVREKNVLFLQRVDTINYVVANTLVRNRFDECEVSYPCKRIRFIHARNQAPTTTEKYFEWLLPIYRGQRGCVFASPKAGKTSLIYEIATAARKNNPDLQVFVLLLDQPPEVVMQFKKGLSGVQLLSTTYEDDCDKQVEAAKRLLTRAKRFAEAGSDVLFLVDSFNALARAYNDTDASTGGKVLAGGMESKTVHYLKKYFGAARCLEKGGSITMLGTVCVGTGNPADDLIASELSPVSNFEIRLSDELAMERLYPAIDFKQTRVSLQETENLDVAVRKKYGNLEVYQMLQSASSLDVFKEKIKN